MFGKYETKRLQVYLYKISISNHCEFSTAKAYQSQWVEQGLVSIGIWVNHSTIE